MDVTKIGVALLKRVGSIIILSMLIDSLSILLYIFIIILHLN